MFEYFMEKASILLRVSTKGEEQHEELQEPECVEYVKNHDWDLFKIYYEQGSAFKNEFDEREVFQELITDAKKNNVKHIVVWNMDRYSRLPAERVLEYTKKLSLFNNIKVHCVNGDSWSEVVEAVSKFKDLGFIGDALSDFLDQLLRGLEHKRAHQESKVKSERVKLAVRKKNNTTISYKGNKWGRPELEIDYATKLRMKKDLGEMSIRKVAEKYCLKKNQVEKIKKELSENQ